MEDNSKGVPQRRQMPRLGGPIAATKDKRTALVKESSRAPAVSSRGLIRELTMAQALANGVSLIPEDGDRPHAERA